MAGFAADPGSTDGRASNTGPAIGSALRVMLRSGLAGLHRAVGGRLPLQPLARSLSWGGADGGTLHYLQGGEPGAPRMVLVHGTPGDAASWSRYLHNPPAGLEVVAPDRPGFGASRPRRARPALADQAAAVAALLPPPGKPALLLGHSMGGAIAARVAAEYPEQVAALVLLASSLDPALERIHPVQPVAASRPWRHLVPMAWRHANDELLALPEELAALAPWLARVRAPVRIVHGTSDDLVPVANARYIAAHLTGAPQCITELLPGMGHFLPWTAEASVRAAMDWARSQLGGPGASHVA